MLTRRVQQTFWIMLLVFFLRLPPLALGVVAVGILGAGGYLQGLENERQAAQAVALAEGPPAAVSITAFDADQHMNAVREVQILAQPSLDYAYRLTIEKDGPDSHVFMVPLVSDTAVADNKIVGIAYFPSDEDFSNVGPDMLMAGMVDFGNVGPVIAYNGRLRGMGEWDDLTEESFFDEGLQMPEDPVIVWPYLEGREVALAPRDPDAFTIFGLLSKVAGAIGLLALMKLVFRKSDDTPEAPETNATPADPAQAFASPAYAAPEPVAAQASEVPLWKQRSGLMQDAAPAPAPAPAAHEPVPEEPDFGFSPEPASFSSKPRAGRVAPADDLVMPQRKPFGLRKVLIGIVGVAFVLLLGSVLYGLVSDARMNDAARAPAVPTAEETLAEIIVDSAVPDADPNRHWTDIDMKPVIEWFTAKALAAATGDSSAQITLALILGLPLLGLFGLRWFFAIRGTMPRKRLYMKLSD